MLYIEYMKLHLARSYELALNLMVVFRNIDFKEVSQV